MNLPLMSCHLYNPRKIKYPCFIQPKLRGIRARFLDGKFYSRDGIQWKEDVVEPLVRKLEKAVPSIPIDLMLDGEFYCHDFTQGQHISAINVNLGEPNDLTKKIAFCVFDFCKIDSPQINFSTRINILGMNNTPDLVPVTLVKDETQLDAEYNMWLKLKYEGVVVTMQDCQYIDGKSHYKLKRKEFKDAEFRCVNVERGSGRNLKRLGALVCKTMDGKYTFNVGTGFADKDRELFYQKQGLVIDRMITVKYQELSEDGIPLCPSFISVRDYE